MKTTPQWILLITGLACWGIVGTSPRVDLAEWLLTLAPLVLVPLAIARLPAPRGSIERRLDGGLRLLQFPAALLFAAAFLVESPYISVGLAGPWVAYTVFSLSSGLFRTVRRRDLSWADRLTGLGQSLMIVGSVSACLAILGIRPFGFPLGIILLTGVHFHYAAFLLPAIASAVARGQHSLGGRRVATGLQAGILVAIPMVAIGILFQPLLEWTGVLLLAVGCVGVALLQFASAICTCRDWILLPYFQRVTGRILLGGSAISLIAAMGLAVAYAWGEFRGLPKIGIETMIRTHGLLNAFGFCGGSLLGWTLLSPAQTPVRTNLSSERATRRISRTPDAAFPTAL